MPPNSPFFYLLVVGQLIICPFSTETIACTSNLNAPETSALFTVLGRTSECLPSTISGIDVSYASVWIHSFVCATTIACLSGDTSSESGFKYHKISRVLRNVEYTSRRVDGGGEGT